MSRPMSTFPEKFRLDGRTALITGSARGLGWEMAKGLAEAGARVLLHGPISRKGWRHDWTSCGPPAGRPTRSCSRWPTAWP